MRSVIMIIFEIGTKNVFQLSFVQDDDVVCALSPDRADPPFESSAACSPVSLRPIVGEAQGSLQRNSR